MPDTESVRSAVDKYGDMLYRICIVMLQNSADAEDAVQETFLRYFRKAPDFGDSEHEKAWLITTASNKCRDILRYKKRHPADSEERLWFYSKDDEDSHIFEALSMVQEKFRIVLTLYYVEEYKVDEIANIIGKTSSAVKMRLKKGRKLLEDIYRKEFL
ncbi:MAG: RNA polymerase sigma factor [Ruminococcus sp.]|nr:RNA polymerase sigma factor [Ruminococcus sp.]HRR77645.1 RNA polymerase sigma factor [Ruminococcus sp.]